MEGFKNILYVTDSNEPHVSGIDRAVSIAENNLATLTVIEVVPPVPDEYRTEIMTSRAQSLETLVDSYRKRLQIRTEVFMGTVFLEVIYAVLHNGHDLVMKDAENPDFIKKLFGSDDMHLLRKCPCPVWLMKSPEKPRYDCIVAAVDFNPLRPSEQEQSHNLEILELASSISLSGKASLHVVHAWEAFAEIAMRVSSDVSGDRIATHVNNQYSLHQKGLYRLGEMLRERITSDAYDSLSPAYHLPKGSAKRKIPELVEELQADLVVMGTVGRTGISGLFMGNTAEAIFDQLNCSVLAVKPPGFTSPVKPA